MSNKEDFLNLVDDAQDAFEKGKKGRQGLVSVEDGKYIVRLYGIEISKVDKSQGKGQCMQVRFNTVVVQAENEDDLGSRVDQIFRIETRSGTKNGKKWEIGAEQIIADISSVTSSFGYDISEAENLLVLFDIIEELEDEELEPACRIEVKTNAGGYKNVRFKKPVEDDDLSPISDVYEDDDEDEDDDDQVDDNDDNDDDQVDDDDDDNDDDDDDDDDDDVEDYIPSKKDVVIAKPKGTKKPLEYTVKTVNTKLQTCTLVRLKDNKEFKSVSRELIEGLAE